MPKLLMFAPCEKVIIDQFNNPTLVSILQQWAPDQRDIPENAFAPQRWDVFTLWYRLAEDAERPTDSLRTKSCGELVLYLSPKGAEKDKEQVGAFP